MIVTVNGIEYISSVSDDMVKIEWDTGSFITSGISEPDALKEVILKPLRVEREIIFQKHGWRAHSANYPYDNQSDWVTYFQKWRDLPSTYVEGEDLVIPTEPKN